MLIGGLQKLTLIDYPGKISCTVFTIGCNFNCAFCHNSELVDPNKIKNQPIISEKYFFEFLGTRQGVLEGVCITGGEPALQPDLLDFIRRMKELGFSVKLDTNGSNPDILENLIKEKLIDYIAMDIKAPLAQFSIFNFQFSKETIKKSIDIIKNSGLDYEFRTTVVPLLHSKEDIIQIAKDLSPAKKYFLQQFYPSKTLDPNFQKEKSYSIDELKELCQTIKSYFEHCEIRS
jgi:pyruvate formate lyase activating enzyme